MMVSSGTRALTRGSTRRKRVFVYLFILGVTTLLVLRVGAQMSILSLGRDIQTIRAERAEIEAEAASLELEAADLRMGSRIKMVAHDCLGMIVPDGAPQKLF